MKVYPADLAFDLVETYVVKTLEASTSDMGDSMVGYEKVLLPPHEQMLTLSIVPIVEVLSLGLSRKWSPSRESVPMLHVDLHVRAPIRMLSLEGVLGADDFAFEVCREDPLLISQTCSSQYKKIKPVFNNVAYLRS